MQSVLDNLIQNEVGIPFVHIDTGEECSGKVHSILAVAPFQILKEINKNLR